MNFFKASLALLALTSSCSAFAPLAQTHRPNMAVQSSRAEDYNTAKYYFMEEKQQQQVEAPAPVPEKAAKPNTAPKQLAKKKPAHGKSGVFSPAVLFVKDLWGDDAAFNKFRAQVISMHSDVISSFVETSDSPTGRAALKTLFQLADRDRNGTIDKEELAVALNALGFDWLKEKQLEGIFKRADKDGNGQIDMDEWSSEVPATLRTNLIKLAKKNGGELGFLA